MMELRLFAVSQIVVPSRSLSADEIISEAAKLVAFIKGTAILPEYCESIDPVDKLIGELKKMQPECKDKDKDEKFESPIS